MVRREIKKSTEPVGNIDTGYTEENNIEHINNLIVTSEDLNPEAAEDNNGQVIEKSVIEPAEKKKEEHNEKESPKELKKKESKILQEPKKEIKKNHSNNEKLSKIKNDKKDYEKKKTLIIKKDMERTKMTKEHKKVSGHEKHHKKHSKMTWVWVVLAVIIVAAAAVLLINGSYMKPINQTTSEVAATVNGEPIYLKDIEDRYNNINPMLQNLYTKETILNQTIDELLLVQEAKNLNIKASDEEVKQELDNFKIQNQLTDSQLEDILAKQNITMTQLEDLIRKKLVVKELLNETIFNNINITARDIENYYNDNKEKFATPEKVTVEHILIMINDNVTDAQAYQKILDINKSLTSTNFCDLVKQYTEDPRSRDTCGTYTFGKGEMVQEFEDAAFSLGINQTTIVKTIYGYHLIKKLADTPAGTPSLANVSLEIAQTLNDMAAQENFDAYLQILRDEAVIVNYLAKAESTATTATNNTQNTGDAQTTTSVEVTPNSDIPTDTVIENTQTASLDGFAKCLTKNGAKFYGASWCPHCNNQKTAFGDSFKYVTYVECAVEGNPQIQTPECDQAGITGYPTWIINGQQYPGEQTLEGLARISGCSLN
jgi:parvulin-like peptidyl-prolyl isomerase